MLLTRSDGRRIRSLPPMQKIIPYIMRSRAASINLFQEHVDCTPLNNYICAHEVNGQRTMSTMHLLIAAIVRVVAQRPQLNRFVVHSRVYARKDIVVSFVVHRSLRIEDGGTTIKLTFNGTESLPQIVQIINDAIARETASYDTQNSTDKLAEAFMRLPGFLIRSMIGFVMGLDKYNLLPNAVLEASPFHATVFLTNLKSLGIDSVYHHQYEFGTNVLFVSMGKEMDATVIERDGSVGIRPIMNLNITLDERFCDGLYFAKSIKILRKYLRDPALLETPLEKKEEDVD